MSNEVQRLALTSENENEGAKRVDRNGTLIERCSNLIFRNQQNPRIRPEQIEGAETRECILQLLHGPTAVLRPFLECKLCRPENM